MVGLGDIMMTFQAREWAVNKTTSTSCRYLNVLVYINTLLDANADRKLGKCPINHTDSEMNGSDYDSFIRVFV